ncbi:ribose 5-phosphate isomerase B [Neorickettsia helminthoeca str. Oregon]|uniref:Ribose 5-phosphate isomerase B n=1 Tax=Neorickettsia helminthoeca str. Oregon TaxID=1286528 RepID=X5HJB7_9RICK|nr:ribose 5-phosphate isomerase B [Neorickettsia helminthoeca]AHX11164.1 ribose 5-phosphate isomerase B [Neorickettsia helminthoeca str. Oregon]
MRISIGVDHAGFNLKSSLLAFFKEKGWALLDRGAHCSGISDYPDFAKAVAMDVAEGNVDFGILICGSGIGMSIVANRYKKVRAALCGDVQSAKLAREHNDANILCLSGRSLTVAECFEIVQVFIDSKFSFEDRHKQRIEKIDKGES